MDVRVELRVHGRHVVLARSEAENSRPATAAFVDPAQLGIDEELTAALHEWARVVAAVRGGGRAAQDNKITGVVARRGRQLAARVAETTGTAVRYHDPATDIPVTVRPSASRSVESATESLFGTSYRPATPVPWLTGLTLALFSGAVVLVIVLALTTAIAAHVTGWLGFVVAVVVAAGLAPSLWLARAVPVLRWAALGAAIGLACSVIGTAVLVS